MQEHQPIGIFDSGVGGLTVAHAITELLPNENIIYFGDTAHHPYGEKSAGAITRYSEVLAAALLGAQCKVIVIACNSAASAAADSVKRLVGKQALVFNVIDPVMNYLAMDFQGKVVGVIGTKQTIHSCVYQNRIQALGKDIVCHAKATPILAPLIEEGFANHQIIHDALTTYLATPEMTDLEALILGCTHYPLIKDAIAEHYHNQIEILDSAQIVATAVRETCLQQKLCNPQPSARRSFYITDHSNTFIQTAKHFFGESITLEYFPLWDKQDARSELISL